VNIIKNIKKAHFVRKEKIQRLRSLSYKQKYNSCVLASYAVIASIFSNGYDLRDFFIAWCEHFKIEGINSDDDAEVEFCRSFQKEYTNRNINGYSIMKEIHETSDVDVFSSCRKLFSLTFQNFDNRDYSLLDAALKSDNSCALIFINKSLMGITSNMHSISLFYCNDYYFYDTNCAKLGNIPYISSLGEIGDCLIIRGT